MRDLIAGGLVLWAGWRLAQGVDGYSTYADDVRRAESEGDMDASADVLARTIWGEARGQGLEGMRAVAAVIVNRARRGGWWGASIVEVCLKPGQFSCWNVGDPNRPKMLAATIDQSPMFAEALAIARTAVRGDLADPTGGATHYHTRYIAPGWAASGQVSARIGTHIFYTGVA